MVHSSYHYHYLFGGDQSWGPEEFWTASDDRVRGGKSQSHLVTASDPHSAVFYGDLDITALGGAGFASQRTADQLSWDLAEYQGLIIRVKAGDNKKYTINIKDYTLPKRPDGRESSTISWEYDFQTSAADITIPWDNFKPTYRGKPKPDTEPLNPKNILRISIMCRSFFGEQAGPFRLELQHIAAFTSRDTPQPPLRQPQAGTSRTPSILNESEYRSDPGDASWLTWIRKFFTRN